MAKATKSKTPARKPAGKAKKPDPPKATAKVRAKIDRGGRRWYTDEERFALLAAVDANGGNCQLTAQQTGVPMQTLWAWKNGHRCPEALQLRNEKKGDLAVACEELAWLVAAEIPRKIEDAPLNHLSSTLGTMIDKVRLLRDLPTSYGRNEVTNVNAPLDTSNLTDAELNAFRYLLARISGRITGPFRPILADGSGGGSDPGGGDRTGLSRPPAAVLG